MINKILVPVDFSKHSEYALEVAAAFAKAHDAEIILLHMLGLHEGMLNTTEGQDVAEAVYFMKLAEKRFTEFEGRKFLEGVRISEMVKNNTHFTEVNDVALEQSADLIIMGSHGSKGLSEVFVGSNTEKVVRTASVPVLVIKEQISEFAPEKVVFGCDFKTENILVYRRAMKLFETLGVAVDLVYVNTPGDRFKTTTQMEAKANEFLAIAEFNAHTHAEHLVYLSGHSIEQAIYAYADKVDADALAIPTHGRRGLSHFFNGSLGEDMANHARMPVFTFKI